jgi:hypothetical protein
MIGRITAGGQPRQIVRETLSLKKKKKPEQNGLEERLKW